MKKIAVLLTALLFLGPLCKADPRGVDVFTPIGKYLQCGDYDKLSVWFADNLELSIFGEVNTCSRNQARLIMKTFFEEYTPKKFTVIHESSQVPLKYALAELVAGGEVFRLLLCVNGIEGKGYIDQLVIARQ